MDITGPPLPLSGREVELIFISDDPSVCITVGGLIIKTCRSEISKYDLIAFYIKYYINKQSHNLKQIPLAKFSKSSRYV